MISHNFDYIVERVYREIVPEGNDFLQSAKVILSGYDDIKARPPVIGDDYFVVEIMVISAINFISVVASNHPLRCHQRSTKSKFSGDDGSFEFTLGSSSRMFPYMTDVLKIDDVVVDTFALLAATERDDLIASLHFLGSKIDVKMI